MLAVLFLAGALALDATAVAAAFATSGARWSVVVRSAVVFGVFQLAMAGVGAVGGAALEAWVSPWDRWVGAVLLVAVGVNMLRGGGEEDEAEPDVRWRDLLGLGLATSIDALAAGVTLPSWAVPVPISVSVIGIVTTAMCILGGWVGSTWGRALGPGVERFGGVVLCGLGVAMLL